MTVFRRLLTAALLSASAAALAPADTIVTRTATYGPQSTDFNWSVDVAKTTGPGDGFHLVGITLDIESLVNVSTLTLNNTAGQNETFGLYAGTNINITGNSASSDAVGDSDFIGIFTSGGSYTGSPRQTITLGPAGSGACPDGRPSASCNTVSYAPGVLTVDDGAIAIASSDWNNYLGNGFVTLSGNTAAYSAFNGGGNNIGLTLSETGQVAATITYDFAPNAAPDAPEPASLILMGSAVAGLAGLRFAKRPGPIGKA